MTRSGAFHALLTGALAAGTGVRVAVAAGDAIRLFSVPNENGISAVYADRNGFFARAGVDVEVALLPNGSAVLSALVGGAADVGVSNPISLAVAHKHGVPIVCFAPTSYYTSKAPTALLLVAKTSPIRGAPDLTGKTIAVVGLKDTSQCATQTWIDQGGGNSALVKFVELHFGEMGSALAAGRIDAAFCAEPALSDALKSARILADTYKAVAPQFLTGTFITTSAFAVANPERIRGIAEALRRTAIWANGHLNESGDILAKVAKIDPAIVRTMRRSTFAERLRAEDLQPPIDLAAKYGSITATFPARELIWSP